MGKCLPRRPRTQGRAVSAARNGNPRGIAPIHFNPGMVWGPNRLQASNVTGRHVTYSLFGQGNLAHHGLDDRLAGIRFSTITTKTTRHLPHPPIQQTPAINTIANGDFSEEPEKLSLNLHGDLCMALRA